jgi:hypothetical protein
MVNDEPPQPDGTTATSNNIRESFELEATARIFPRS